MPLGMEVGLGPGDIVLDGDPAPPPPKKAQSPNFLPMSIAAKRLDASGYRLVQKYASAQATLCEMVIGEPAPAPSPQKASQQPPLFVPCLLWPNRWMDQDDMHLVRH